MSIIESLEGVAQSISVNHYEKYISETFIQAVREDVLQYKTVTSARSILMNFTVECLDLAQSYILDIARQQHQTSELSISNISLRNALIYFLSEQTVSVSRYLNNSHTEHEENILLYEQFPKLLASLQMIHEKSEVLPCFLQTQDMQSHYVESIQTRLKDSSEPNIVTLQPLTVYDILSDPLDKKLYTIFTKYGEIVAGKLSYRTGHLQTEVLELVESQYPGKIQPVSFANIERITVKPESSYPEYSLEEVQKMSCTSILYTLLTLLENTLKRTLSVSETEMVLEISKNHDLAHSLINGLSKLNRKE